jgi:hypothetical protein
VVAALRLTGHGGGYTIDQWGLWAAVTVVAAGVALISQPVSRLSGVQRLLPLSLLGLALWSMLSAHWAAWPQSALVEGDRYLFYAAVATLPLVLLPTAAWRRGLVGGVAAGTAVPALLVALKLWQSGAAAALFDSGRLVGSVGYGGGLAAAVAIGFWPLVAFASDRTTTRALRPLAGLGAGLALATVVPTEARASVWALAVSAVVFFLLCPTPIRSGFVAAGAALPTLLFWHQLNSVFSSQTGGHPHSVGIAILLTGALSALVAGAQTLLDEVVTLSEATGVPSPSRSPSGCSCSCSSPAWAPSRPPTATRWRGHATPSSARSTGSAARTARPRGRVRRAAGSGRSTPGATTSGRWPCAASATSPTRELGPGTSAI